MDLVNIPKTKRGRETLNNICNSAKILFSENGYFNTGIVDIAQKSGVAQGTVYIYFKDKKSIFRYIVKSLDTELRKAINDARKTATDRYTEEYLGIKTFLEFVDQNVGIFKIIWQAQFVDMELFTDYYDAFSTSYIKGIKRAQDAGEIREIDPQVLSYCFIGISNFIALKYIIFEDRKDYDYIIESVMDFIKDGAFIDKTTHKRTIVD